MIDTNYRVEALEYLLEKECLSEKYYPLIPFKETLIIRCRQLGYKTKNDIAALSDADFPQLGIQEADTVRLLRKFLKLYEPNPQKFKEIEKMDAGEEERNAFRDLYFLPGVKYTRAFLYFQSGYKSLQDIADASLTEILERTAAAIAAQEMSCTVPFPKEVRTHIAVAKAFTQKP